MNYRQLVASHLKALADDGRTQKQIAALIGVRGRNYISMLINPHGQEILALKRVPALAAALKLSDREALTLPYMLGRDHPNHASALDVDTLTWLMRTTVRACAEMKKAKERKEAKHGR